MATAVILDRLQPARRAVRIGPRRAAVLLLHALAALSAHTFWLSARRLQPPYDEISYIAVARDYSRLGGRARLQALMPVAKERHVTDAAGGKLGGVDSVMRPGTKVMSLLATIASAGPVLADDQPGIQPATISAGPPVPPPLLAPAPPPLLPSAAAPVQSDPLARDNVDVTLAFGPTWRGTAADAHWSDVGLGAVLAIDVGRPPYWGGVYASAGTFRGRPGFVDPMTGNTPGLALISGGYRAKVAMRLGQRWYLMPAIGIGICSSAYSSSGGVHGKTINESQFIGFGLEAQATVAYAWRFGAVVLQPVRVDAFLMDHRTAHSSNTPPVGGFGVNRNGVSYGATLGISLDLSAMVLALRDAGMELAGQFR